MKAVEVRRVSTGWQAVVVIDNEDALWGAVRSSPKVALHAMLDVLDQLGWEPER